MRRLTTDAPAPQLTIDAPAVTITALYDDARPRRLTGYQLGCLGCGATWPATPSRSGDWTDAGLDRQARAHRCTTTTSTTDPEGHRQ